MFTLSKNSIIGRVQTSNPQIKVSSSNYQQMNPPDNMLDDNQETYWSTLSSASIVTWFKFDLSIFRTIVGIELFWPNILQLSGKLQRGLAQSVKGLYIFCFSIN